MSSKHSSVAADSHLLLLGVGHRLGHLTPTLLKNLHGCSHIWCLNVPPELVQRLRTLFQGVEDVTGVIHGGDAAVENALTARLSAKPKPKKSALLFLGHPLLYSLVPRLMRYCNHHAIRFRIVNAVSSMEAVMAVIEPHLEEKSFILHGAQVGIWKAPVLATDGAEFDARRTAVILELEKLRDWTAFVDRLEREHRKTHAVCVLERSPEGDSERYLQTTVEGLRELSGRFGEGSALFIPLEVRLPIS